MQIAYDWNSAFVLDEQGQVLDVESQLDSLKLFSIIERLELLGADALTPEARRLIERWPEASVHIIGDSVLPEFEGIELTEEQQSMFDEAALQLAESGVAKAAGDPDRRLEHLLRATDELRAAWTTLESRLVEWIGLFLPQARFERDRSQLAHSVSSAHSITELADTLGVQCPESGPDDGEWRSLHEWAETVTTFQSKLDRMESAIRNLANEYLPSLSNLVGPLLAARLCVSANGRMRLARFPSGTVQILGAEKAFFNHLHTGAAPPKHGHLFMHPWISRSPFWVRGKISRMLAAKCSLAVRCDAFGGEIWTSEIIEQVEAKVQEIRDKFPNSTKGVRSRK